jgi:hypothetical protein
VPRDSEFVRAGGSEVERQEEYLVRAVCGMYDSSSLEVLRDFSSYWARARKDDLAVTLIRDEARWRDGREKDPESCSDDWAVWRCSCLPGSVLPGHGYGERGRADCGGRDRGGVRSAALLPD